MNLQGERCPLSTPSPAGTGQTRLRAEQGHCHLLVLPPPPVAAAPSCPPPSVTAGPSCLQVDDLYPPLNPLPGPHRGGSHRGFWPSRPSFPSAPTPPSPAFQTWQESVLGPGAQEGWGGLRTALVTAPPSGPLVSSWALGTLPSPSPSTSRGGAARCGPAMPGTVTPQPAPARGAFGRRWGWQGRLGAWHQHSTHVGVRHPVTRHGPRVVLMETAGAATRTPQGERSGGRHGSALCRGRPSDSTSCGCSPTRTPPVQGQPTCRDLL